jgi:hypothetical protein
MTTETKERKLTFTAGGWVLILACVGAAAVPIQVALHLGELRANRIGDGQDVSTYRFDLTKTLVPEGEIVAGGMWRDKLMAMGAKNTAPAVWTVEEHDANRSRRGRTMLVGGDRVIGVEIGGESRAYPLMLLNWHEIVNDTLGGRKIAVTYHPLCDSVAVFDREVGDEVLEFRVSGLLLRSNQLMYEHRPEIGTESLWSQLKARAIAGPMAGTELETIPFTLCRWADWVEKHPATTVLAPKKELVREYGRKPYGSYFGKQVTRFEAKPWPPEEGRAPWSRVVVGEDGVVADYPLDPIVLKETPDPESRPVRFHAFWWAWYAARSDSR